MAYGIKAISAATLLALLAVGCTPEIKTVYVTATLNRPERPVLPKVKAEQLDCLTEPTYQALYDRQRLISDYAAILETIIDSTKPADKTDKLHLDKPEQN